VKVVHFLLIQDLLTKEMTILISVLYVQCIYLTVVNTYVSKKDQIVYENAGSSMTDNHLIMIF